jgi:hypothetical protein
LLGAALLLFAPFAIAQDKLGELLDAGAKVLPPEQFKQELVQQVLVGPTPSGVGLEVVYTTKGLVQGSASGMVQGMAGLLTPVNGEWKIDENGRICTSMRFGLAYGPGGGMTLPFRCQFWFKYKDVYFLADSDSDRQVRVFRRTVKQ